MTGDGLAREYENAVADILSYLSAGVASVERDVNLPGHDSGIDRQIDILVTGKMAGILDARLVVDCKRWNQRIDVNDAGAFRTLVEDVNAQFGLIVTTLGASVGAIQLLEHSRGLQLKVISVEDLAGWRPAGTRSATYAVQATDMERACAVVRNAGLRVTLSTGADVRPGEIAIEAFRHYANATQDAAEPMSTGSGALDAAGIIFRSLGSSVVAGGGTPFHRWLHVVANGVRTDLKILAATESEVATQLDSIAAGLGILPSALDVERPVDWPAGESWF